MKKIPIAFCFDDNLELPAGACLTSLLLNAQSDTFYDIFILHSDQSTFPHGRLNELPLKYGNCSITYRCVGKEFEGAFEIRGITIAAYYRLLIPELIPEYNRIIYSDVDVIFREDLSSIFEHADMTDCYVAGVVDASYFSPNHRKYIVDELGLNWNEYIYDGNMILNSQLIRQDHLVEKFRDKSHSSAYRYQEMDIINLVCRGKIKRLPPVFCLSTEISKYAACKLEQPLYSITELLEAQDRGIVHYSGPKPWKQYCLNFDIWWEYYRKSIFFDPQFYYDFYRIKLDEYDRLSLWKRVKILLRYFKTRGCLK
ncbi:glycosyltransferase family 8 protein [uncultured Bacteroides sp.]|uniref:glycosyltransferase family 8 protein n=1 Tax=uncultured Bacteroides sp. TaxID=162156 RepID=UPI002AAB5B4C|nr:glycosyltransferase family 8 protein [uncultured Bacteroides sp.]